MTSPPAVDGRSSAVFGLSGTKLEMMGAAYLEAAALVAESWPATTTLHTRPTW